MRFTYFSDLYRQLIGFPRAVKPQLTGEVRGMVGIAAALYLWVSFRETRFD